MPRMRVVRFSSRNPLVVAALVVLVLAVLALVLAASVTLAAVAAMVGGGVLLARRATGRRLRPRAERPSGQEVFPPSQRDITHRLPPGPVD